MLIIFNDCYVKFLIVDICNNKTFSIKKYSLKSFNANDRSRKIIINFAFVFFKIDKFNQYLIQFLNAINYQIFFVQLSKFNLNAKIRTIVSQFAYQSTITYHFHLFNFNCKT